MLNGDATDLSREDATSAVDTGTPLDELPPIDVAVPTMLVIDLSASELISLCDWNAREFGGYGGNVPCPDAADQGIIGAPESVQDCVSVLQVNRWGPDCPLTVQDFMSCVTWQVDNVCNILTLTPPPECKTQEGPQCEGAIFSDVLRPAMADAEASSPEGGDETSEAAPDAVDAGIDGADGWPD
jgi:hypothetical protein